jgi:hypothetical protein
MINRYLLALHGMGRSGIPFSLRENLDAKSGLIVGGKGQPAASCGKEVAGLQVMMVRTDTKLPDDGGNSRSKRGE